MDTKSQTNKGTIRNLAIFTVLVIVLGWLGRWVDSVMGSTSSEGIDLGNLASSVSPGYHTLHD